MATDRKRETPLLTESDLRELIQPAAERLVTIATERLSEVTAQHQRTRGEEEQLTAEARRERREEEQQVSALRAERATLLVDLAPLRAEVAALQQQKAELAAAIEAQRRLDDELDETHRRHAAERAQKTAALRT